MIARRPGSAEGSLAVEPWGNVALVIGAVSGIGVARPRARASRVDRDQAPQGCYGRKGLPRAGLPQALAQLGVYRAKRASKHLALRMQELALFQGEHMVLKNRDPK